MAAPKGKGMQLGRKTNNTTMFEKVRADLGEEANVESAPLISSQSSAAAVASPRASMSADRGAISITVSEQLLVELTRDGALKSLEVKGDLQLRVTDPSVAKIRLDVVADSSDGTQFRPHPNVDKALFTNSKAIQLRDASRPFPSNGQPLGVLRWRLAAKPGDESLIPLGFTVWVNKGSDENHTITVEYELHDTSDTLSDVTVSIPLGNSEPNVSSFDADYNVSGSEITWTIGTVDADAASGSFEFEAVADDESEFFPMNVSFAKGKPFVTVDVSPPFVIHILLYKSFI